MPEPLVQPFDLNVSPPEFLYHYTSLAAARNIVAEGKLWASNLHFLNDASEYAYPVGLIRQRLMQLAQSGVGPISKYLSLYATLDVLPHFDAYIACFSAKADDLAQWRGYSSSGQGACIKFRGNILQNFRRKQDVNDRKSAPRLVPVIYLDETQTTYFDYAIRDPQDSTYAYISNFAPLFKNHRFKVEEEWRAMASISVDTFIPDELNFRMSGSTLVPYTFVNLGSLRSDVIAEVMIGPSPNGHLSAKAFELFLRSSGKASISVTRSSIPYRYL